MADEIKITLGINYANGELADTVPQEIISIDQADQDFDGGVVDVGTSEEDLVTGDIVTLGVIYMKNLDDTNYVTYGPKSASAMVPFGRIKPGEAQTYRLEPGVTLRWLANAASVKVLTKLYND